MVSKIECGTYKTKSGIILKVSENSDGTYNVIYSDPKTIAVTAMTLDADSLERKLRCDDFKPKKDVDRSIFTYATNPSSIIKYRFQNTTKVIEGMQKYGIEEYCRMQDEEYRRDPQKYIKENGLSQVFVC